MNRKIVYLTIDDSPSKNMKEKVDFLYKRKIPAIFFCEGGFLEKNLVAAVHAIKKGFIIGNHSYNHPRFSRIPLKECFQEIRKTDGLIDRVYKMAGVKRRVKVFRFPYGDKGDKLLYLMLFGRTFMVKSPFGRSKKRKLQAFLSDLGYRQPGFSGITYSYFKKLGLDKGKDVFWTYDLEEYRLPSNTILRKMSSGRLSDKRSADIVLMHDHINTHKEFFVIIDKLIQMGVEFNLPKFSQ